MTTYQFDTQLKKGLEGENAILEYFKHQWIITPSNREDQRRGIDFHFVDRQDPTIKLAIEVKTDSRASQTGNAFIETYSAYPKKPGWAFTCKANWLFYYLPQNRIIYCFSPSLIQKMALEWMATYPHRDIKNESWTTRGVLVPLRELEEHSDGTYLI